MFRVGGETLLQTEIQAPWECRCRALSQIEEVLKSVCGSMIGTCRVGPNEGRYTVAVGPDTAGILEVNWDDLPEEPVTICLRVPDHVHDAAHEMMDRIVENMMDRVLGARTIHDDYLPF